MKITEHQIVKLQIVSNQYIEKNLGIYEFLSKVKVLMYLHPKLTYEKAVWEIIEIEFGDHFVPTEK